ncbi:hypothetical protein VUR80DRAFT_9049 [Thermomyces stellatus]
MGAASGHRLSTPHSVRALDVVEDDDPSAFDSLDPTFATQAREEAPVLQRPGPTQVPVSETRDTSSCERRRRKHSARPAAFAISPASTRAGSWPTPRDVVPRCNTLGNKSGSTRGHISAAQFRPSQFQMPAWIPCAAGALHLGIFHPGAGPRRPRDVRYLGIRVAHESLPKHYRL